MTQVCSALMPLIVSNWMLVKKFIQFQLTVNITAVLLTFISAVSAVKTQVAVLTAVQLLWVNLIMDTLAALALATDGPDDEILDRQPESRAASLITFNMWKMIIAQAVFQVTVCLLLLYGAPYWIPTWTTSELYTFIFNTFVWLQLFNEIK